MEFAILGPVRVLTDSGRPVTAPAQRKLLALLLSRPNKAIAADTLADALWPDQASTPARLQLLVHKTRKAIGAPERIEFGNGGYRLTVLPGELDAERFDALCSSTDADGRVARLREGLALWRGEPCADLADLPALAAHVARLTAQRFAALEQLYTAEIGLGRSADIVAELTDIAAEHPTRERFVALLMIALQQCGRQADALAAYRTTRRHLVDELGIEPGTELRRVQRAVLAGEAPVVEPAPAPTVPARLPPDIARFAGRGDELARLDQLLADGTTIAVLTGPAGTGKTALAVHWANRSRDRFPDGQMYVNLRGFSAGAPADSCAVVALLLDAVGVHTGRIPCGVEERTALLRSTLDGRRLLLVLDNARNAAHVRPLLPGRGPFVLVTSRNRLAGLGAREGAGRIVLGELPTADALAVLAGTVEPVRPASASRAAVALVAACAGLPLALTIMAERLAGRPGTPPHEFVAELDADAGLTEVHDVLSWSYDALDEQAARLFRLLALAPGADISAADAAVLAAWSPLDTNRALRRLVDANLIKQRPHGRYEYHALVRDYAVQVAARTESADDRAHALRRLLDWYADSAPSTADSVITRADSGQAEEIRGGVSSLR